MGAIHAGHTYLIIIFNLIAQFNWRIYDPFLSTKTILHWKMMTKIKSFPFRKSIKLLFHRNKINLVEIEKAKVI